MAWELSISAEGMQNVYEQIHNKDREWLSVCYAENCAKASREHHANGFNERKYNIALKRAANLPLDVLADSIWESVQKINTTENGAFLVWCCPWGCHTVPPEPVEGEEEEE